MAFLTPAINRGARQASIGLARIDSGFAEEWEPAAWVDEILWSADQATLAETVIGRGWYLEAHQYAYKLALENETFITQAAGVIAACSPRNEWNRNMEHAAMVFRGERPSFLSGLFYDRAALIARGAPPEMVLGGRKVRSFHRNIWKPLEPGPVTIDGHASDVLGINPKLLERPGVYQLVAACYRKAARVMDWLPQEVQGVTWTVEKRLKETR